jgi:transposase
MSQRRYELTDFEWMIIEPLLPNKPRGVARVDDRKVLNGIYWRLRTGSPWADIPERYGPYTTCYNRFVRWARIGVWDRIFAAVSAAYEGSEQSVDSSSIRVHQHGANAKRGAQKAPEPPIWLTFEPSAWAFAGRPDHQDPCRHRRARPADRSQADAGTGA